MTQPHELNPIIIKLIDAHDFVGVKNYNRSHINNRTCSNCESYVEPGNYKGLVKDEYFISGLCKECQKWFFDEPGKKIS
jgi:hypothetical protein